MSRAQSVVKLVIKLQNPVMSLITVQDVSDCGKNLKSERRL